MSEDVFNEIDDGLEPSYRLEGAVRTLGEFTGVVDVSDESRTYYEWRVVSMGEESGVELTAESGTVHTYSVEYFADQLEAGRYRPAISTGDGVRVATVEGDTGGADASVRRDATAGSSPEVGEASEDATASVSGETEDAIDSPTVADESSATVLGDADSPAGSAAEQTTDAAAQENPDDTAANDESAGVDEGAEIGEDVDADESAAADEAAGTDRESDDSTGSGPQQDEVERLRAVVTDTTRHKYVRENAIRELGDHGERGAAVLADVVDDESITAEERALASVLLRDLRTDAD